MSEYKIRRRQRLKAKQAKAVVAELDEVFGEPIPIWDGAAPVELAEAGDLEILLVAGQIVGIKHEGKAFLSLRGLMAAKPRTRFVTVDMGAVRFVTNGADIMSPGVVDADPALEAGDLAWVRDEKNGAPLGVVQMTVSGAEIKAATSGKGAKALLHVGDKIWQLDA